MRLYAPAKINWTLEVLGRPPEADYHEVRTVIQTVEPCDALDVAPADGLEMEVEGVLEPLEDDLVLRAAALLGGGGGGGASICLSKRIPLAAGLGGGSSDAAATLRALNELWRLGYADAQLAGMGAGIGSDVAFFVYGGTALAEGRGERVTPLPDVPPTWLVLVVPPFRLPEKTRRMYSALTPADFTDGSRTEALLRRLRQGRPIADDGLYNAFERAAYDVFDGLHAYRDALLEAGARRVHLAGSGPALFALGPEEEAARAVYDRLRPPAGQAAGRAPVWAQVVRTLTAAEARVSED
jgi:4-diphosphocytidyl-2-C-methyl-D-erythritol kinase